MPCTIKLSRWLGFGKSA